MKGKERVSERTGGLLSKQKLILMGGGWVDGGERERESTKGSAGKREGLVLFPK
jgi:hypothetical protein